MTLDAMKLLGEVTAKSVLPPVGTLVGRRDQRVSHLKSVKTALDAIPYEIRGPHARDFLYNYQTLLERAEFEESQSTPINKDFLTLVVVFLIYIAAAMFIVKFIAGAEFSAFRVTEWGLLVTTFIGGFYTLVGVYTIHQARKM